MLKGFHRAGFCTLAAVGMAVPAAAQSVDLDWKFEQGETHKYRTDVTQEQVISGDQLPQEMNMTQMTGMDMSYKVQEINEGVANVKVTTDAVRFKASNPMQGMDIQYDSNADEEPPEELAALDSLIGTSFTVAIDESGSVQEVSGVDKLLNQLSEDGNPQTRGMLRSFLNKEAITTQFEQQFQLLPSESVNQGESWQNTETEPFPGLGQIQVSTGYTYEGNSDKSKATDRVAFNGENASLEQSENSQAEISLEKADLSGSYDFSRDMGQLINLNRTLDMVLNVQQQGMNMTLELAKTTETELLN